MSHSMPYIQFFSPYVALYVWIEEYPGELIVLVLGLHTCACIVICILYSVCVCISQTDTKGGAVWGVCLLCLSGVFAWGVCLGCFSGMFAWSVCLGCLSGVFGVFLWGVSLGCLPGVFVWGVWGVSLGCLPVVFVWGVWGVCLGCLSGVSGVFVSLFSLGFVSPLQLVWLVPGCCVVHVPVFVCGSVNCSMGSKVVGNCGVGGGGGGQTMTVSFSLYISDECVCVFQNSLASPLSIKKRHEVGGTALV